MTMEGDWTVGEENSTGNLDAQAGLGDTQILVKEAKEGDEEALQALFARYYERIRPLVRARLGQELRKKIDSDDIIQIAFGAALQSFDQFEHETEGAFVHWLSSIISHTICDNADHYMARKRGGQVVHLDGRQSEKILAAQPATDPGPSTRAETLEEEERLMSALDRLEADKREVLILLRFQQLTYREIGLILGCRESAVQMRVVRAERELAKIYAAMNGECT